VDVMRHGRGSILLENPRARVLEELAAAGPLTLAEIPLGWPVTRPMLRGLVRELMDAGLVEVAPSRKIPGGVAYSLTRSGRRRVATGVVEWDPARLAG
jgi:DNA-binding HxlR family transcriptional regulator